MHAFSIGLLCSTLILSACGGADPPRSIETAATCELPLKYADGMDSGYRISPDALAVPRQFNPCPIRQLVSADVSLCIDHPQINELSAQLILPNQTSLSLEVQQAARGSSCLISGQLFTLPLPLSKLQAFRALEGDWSVKVIDNDTVSSTPMGYLVGWSLQAKGLK